MLRGVIAFIIVLAAACIAETITMPKDELPPVITLVQEEPEYHENTDIVGQENAVNVQKFSNPTFCSGDEQTTTTNNQEEGTSSAVVSTTESEPLNRETELSSSLHDHTTTHTDGLPVERLDGHVCSTNPDRLTRSKGIVTFNGHRETWYSLPMQGVVRIMRNCGFDEASYPYSVCDNCGCKLLGDFIMLAADTYKIERGTLVETSLGTGIVADHCGRSEKESDLFDIAVNW